MSDTSHVYAASHTAADRAQSRASAAVREHGWPLLIYSALAILLTWPLAANLGSAFPSAPGESAQDLWEKLWDIWWVGEALRRGVNPFFTDVLFYPGGASLLFHPLNATNGLLALPLRALFGAIATYNLLVLLSFVLSGYAVYLLARAHGCGRAAALIGGLAYTASTFHFFHTQLSHMELIPMQWLPLYALALDGLLTTTDHRPPTNAGWRAPLPGRSSFARVLLAALALLVVIYTSLYIALYAALLTLVWVVWSLLALRGRAWPGLLRLAAMTLLTLAVVGPTLLVPMAREMRQSQYMLKNLDATAQLAAAPADILLPPASHPLRAILALPEPYNRGSFLGYLPLLLAVGGAIARPRAAGRWVALALLAWAFTLGPALPLFEWLYTLPLLSVSRYPDRFIILALLAVAVLAAFGADALLSRTKDERRKTKDDGQISGATWLSSVVRRRSSVVGPLLFALLLLELYPGPAPLTAPPDNPFYHELAREPGQGSVLELPINRSNSAWLAMYAQTIHGRPILDGALARPVPHVPFAWLPLMRELEHPDGPTDILWQSAPERAAALRYFDLRFVIYHHADERGPVVPPLAAALSRAAGVPASQVYADEELTAFKLDLPAGPAALPAAATLGAGWYDLEGSGADAHRWLEQGGGAVQVYAPQDEQVTLRLKLVSFGAPRRLDIFLDEQPVAQVEAQPWLAEVRAPPFALVRGPHTLRLVPAGPGVSPRATGAGGDDRPLTVGLFELEVEIGD
jgi:hypothetical protein